MSRNKSTPQEPTSQARASGPTSNSGVSDIEIEGIVHPSVAVPEGMSKVVLILPFGVSVGQRFRCQYKGKWYAGIFPPGKSSGDAVVALVQA